MCDLAVLYLPGGGRVAHHLPLPPGPTGAPMTVPEWADVLLPADLGPVVWAVVDDATTGLTGPIDPPPTATALAR